MTTRRIWQLARALLVIAVASLPIGCESGSGGSSSSDGTFADYAGTYQNGGQPLAPLQSGDKVTSMQVGQSKDVLVAADNHGITFSGSIGVADSSGNAGFTLNGKTTDGTAVTIVGAFSRDGNRAIMSGNWVEPSAQSTFLGYSAATAAAAPAPAAATPAPTTTTPTTQTTPAPTPAADPMPDPVDLSQAEWRRGDFGKNASREVVLESVDLQHTKIGWSTFGPITWDNIGSGSDIEGDLCLFKYMGSQLVGGQIDAVKRGQTSKGLDNVLAPDGNYLGSDWHMVPGETIYVCLIGYRHGNAVRSNVIQAQYP